MKILNLTLLAALILSCINVAAVAPTKNQKKIEAKTSKKPAKGWSLKAKAIAAFGVVATGMVAVAIYRYRLATQQSDLDKIFAFNQQNNAPQHQIPAGNARELFQYSLDFNENFQQAMREPQSAHNFQQLFHNQRFIALMNNPQADLVRERLRAVFNDPELMHISMRNDFVGVMINIVDAIMPK